MANPLPYITGTFELMINGINYALSADEIQQVKHTPKKVDYKAGGMPSPRKVSVGFEPMEVSFKVTGHADEILVAMGGCGDKRNSITIKENTKQVGSCDKRNRLIKMVGTLKEYDEGTLTSGEVNTTTVSFDVTRYELYVDGKQKFKRDDETGQIWINGVLQK